MECIRYLGNQQANLYHKYRPNNDCVFESPRELSSFYKGNLSSSHIRLIITQINSKPAGSCSIIPFIALDILHKTIKYSRRSPCDPSLVSNNSYYSHSSCYKLRPLSWIWNPFWTVIESSRELVTAPFISDRQHWLVFFLITFKFYQLSKRRQRGQAVRAVDLSSWLGHALTATWICSYRRRSCYCFILIDLFTFLFFFCQRLTWTS